MTDQQSICPHCGKPASQKLLGMCPECMLKAGLGSLAGEGTIREAAGRFVPPTVEELGRYFPQLDILELIGRGGMGAVYKARQKQLDRIVALKILPPGIGGENAEARMQNAERGGAAATAFAERFTREAKALAALAHPNIVTLYEFGQTDGLFFFLMEFVDGVNLRQLLSGGKLAPKEALAIVPHICDALQYAHDRGIVHRDIKPENILLGRDGVVKIADFGVAKIIGQVPPVPSPAEFPPGAPTSNAPATSSEKVIGTPAYMAPEQLDRPSDVDHRADIYSLGVVLYQMLTGELPGKQIEPPSRKVQIDVRLDEIVLRALERNPEMRYSQASVFKTEVETIASTPPGYGATPPNATPPVPTLLPPLPGSLPASRFSRAAVLAACWSVFAVLASLFWWVSSPEYGPGKTLTTLGYLLAIALVPLGITAPFGTTIIGWVVVAQIRHSAGRLYGLGLAVFDGLLFPLLALDLVIARLWEVALDILATQVRGALAGGPPMELGPGMIGMIAEQRPGFLASLLLDHRQELLLIAAGLTSILIDWLIVRRVWRAVNKINVESAATAQAAAAPPPASPPPIRIASLRHRRPWLSAVIVAFLCGVATFLSLRPTYTAHGTLFLAPEQTRRPAAADSSQTFKTAIRRHISAIQEPAFLQAAMATLERTPQTEPLLRLSPAQLAANLAVSYGSDDLMQVSYTDSDPSRAALAVETIVRAYSTAPAPANLSLTVVQWPEVPGPQPDTLRRMKLSCWAAILGGVLAMLVVRFGRVPRLAAGKMSRPTTGAATASSSTSLPPAPVKEQTNTVHSARRNMESSSNRRVAWIFTAVTVALHTAVFLALLIFAAFVIPNFESIFQDFKSDLPLLTRMTIALTHGIQGFWYLMIPLFVAVDAGICLLLGYLNARKSLIAWLICGTALLLIVAGAMFLSLFLPMHSLLQTDQSLMQTIK